MEQEKLYGIYSSVSRKFVFGIKEPSKTKAWKALEKRIGNDSRKWRFEAKKIPNTAPPELMSKQDMKTLLEGIAEQVIKAVKAQGVVVQRYDSYSSNSIYLKFDYGVLNSLRISDHQSKKDLAYRYNILYGIKKSHINKHKGFDRFFSPVKETQMMIDKILYDRRVKLLNYGWTNYVTYMENNINDNKDAQGFWAQAELV